MPSFRVTWEIDMEADTPREAARLAFETVQRPGTSANVFDVADAAGTVTRVDLEEDDDDDESEETCDECGAHLDGPHDLGCERWDTF